MDYTTAESFEYYRFKADVGQELLRIDRFLMDRIPSTSRTKIQNGIHSGLVMVNEAMVKPNYKIKPGDIVVISLPEEKISHELIPENIPLNIVYEDADIIIINKQSGLVVHPGYGNYSGTLINGLIYHFEELKTEFGDNTRPGLVHRIDKDTTGLLVVAKNEMAHMVLAKQFFERSLDRSYVALVWGDLQGEGEIEGHLGRSPKDRKIMTVFQDESLGKYALTTWKAEESFHYVTLVNCRLKTGRTHQIRAHFKHIGHPLFGDVTYGGDRVLKGALFSKYKQFVDNCFSILPRQALHAKSLGFIHPSTKKWMQFEAPLPDDFSQVVDKWRNYLKYRGEEDN